MALARSLITWSVGVDVAAALASVEVELELEMEVELAAAELDKLEAAVAFDVPLATTT